MRLQYATDNDAFGTIPTEFYQIAAKFVEDITSSGVSEIQTGENSERVEHWRSHSNGIGLGALDDLLNFQGLPFPIYNAFEFQEKDFSFTDSDTAAVPEAGEGFDFPGFMADPFPQDE
ncbi:hypothetical protein NW759_016925 [Fusarium solani]|nr:hypothetical protein NW759_016925 [Fusarium solani]